MLPQLELLRDMAADGRKVMLPLMDREIPLVADSWAKPELGSGCVKITPAHDPNDYEVGQRVGLPMINILNPDGTINAEGGKYEGLTIPQARKAVVADLEELGLLGDIEDRDIELPHSDRSKTPIEPYLADQWFVAMDELAQSAMDAVTDERVKIFPERYRKGYLDWLGEKRDWPVSRQLWWGHRIPIWSQTDLAPADRGSIGQESRCDHRGQPTTKRATESTKPKTGRQGSLSVLRNEGDRREAELGRIGFAAGPGCAGYLVFLGAVAAQHAGLARADAGAGVLLSDQHADHLPRHHHLVGRPDGVDGIEQRWRSSVPRSLHPSQDLGRHGRNDEQEQGERCRSDRRDRQVRSRCAAVRVGPIGNRHARRADASSVRMSALRKTDRSDEEESIATDVGVPRL